MAMSMKARTWTGEQLLLCIERLKDSTPGVSRTEAWLHFRRYADELTRELTAFSDLADMVSRWNLHGYRPTIRDDRGIEYMALADAYDFEAQQLGLGAVAFRG